MLSSHHHEPQLPLPFSPCCSSSSPRAMRWPRLPGPVPSLSSPRSAPRATSSIDTLRGALKDLHLAEACPPPHLSHFGLVVLLLLLFLFILAGMVFADAGEFTAWGRVGGIFGRSGSFADLPRCIPCDQIFKNRPRLYDVCGARTVKFSEYRFTPRTCRGFVPHMEHFCTALDVCRCYIRFLHVFAGAWFSKARC